MVIKKGRNWNLPERLVIGESRYWNRRDFIKKMGIGAAAVCAAGVPGCVNEETSKIEPAKIFVPDIPEWIQDLYPAEPNPDFAEIPPGRQMTPEQIANTFNNFYEFGIPKTEVHKNAGTLVTRPWAVEIAGLVHNPVVLDVDDMYKLFDLEERIYRLRCVEAWSMVVPWTGWPLRKLLEYANPMGSAKFVRMISFDRPDQAVGQRELTQYDWPYYEGLSMAEAMNEITMLVTGIFGNVTPPQHGSPFRLITPWKYGYKSIKSIVRIELTDQRPPTFWNDAVPSEYSFTSNVDPTKPHPRWSQATERDIGTEEQIETLPYNGYGEWVADLYE
jgi:methionine sulfoxide reductase catalytic subunit